MNEPEKIVEGSRLLADIFGHWPSFHDAEVIEFNLWRGAVGAGANGSAFPVLVTKIHLWETTSEVDAKGIYVLLHPTLATLRFSNVDELKMGGFNKQNVIFGLEITCEAREGGLPSSLRVEFKPCFGLSATFRCSRIEVVGAEPLPGP